MSSPYGPRVDGARTRLSRDEEDACAMIVDALRSSGTRRTSTVDDVRARALARPFDPSDLHPLLDRNGIDAVVLVQGACIDTDTDYLLSEAARHDSIAAVTAWLMLDDPQRARVRLDELGAHRAFRAVRHLIHNEADPHWILRPAVLESRPSRGARRGPRAAGRVPRHLADVPVLAQRFRSC